jgi:hypothetical protein
MAYKDRPPLTDADGEAREMTAEDFVWFVETSDFPDHDAAIAFLMRRAEIFRAAELAGFEREIFLPLAPSKPGFEDRVAEAFGAVLKTVKHAAE